MDRPKVLIVEDEEPILRALDRVFCAAGFLTVLAADGEEGFAVGMREKPDLIIFDIVMPRLDGIEMLRRMRYEGGGWGRAVKGIVYSNLSYNEKREEARGLGVTDFLVKANIRLADVVRRAKEELEAAEREAAGNAAP